MKLTNIEKEKLFDEYISIIDSITKLPSIVQQIQTNVIKIPEFFDKIYNMGYVKGKIDYEKFISTKN
jgi:hypothetical protein